MNDGNASKPKRNPAGYDEALAGRELDGGESLLSGTPREADPDAAAELDLPDESASGARERAEP